MPGLFTAPVLYPTSFNKAASQERIHELGSMDLKVLQVTGPSAYPNPAGIPCPASLFGLRALEWVLPVCNKAGTREYTLDPATGNIHAFVGTTGAEVANGVDLSADLVFLLAAGIR